MKDAGRPVPTRKPKKKSGKTQVSPSASGRTRSVQAKKRPGVSDSEPQVRVEQALRTWRLSEAKRRNIPAFRIFGDRALRSIATACPQNDAELLVVSGIGMSIVKKYGARIYRLVADSR